MCIRSVKKGGIKSSFRQLNRKILGTSELYNFQFVTQIPSKIVVFLSFKTLNMKQLVLLFYFSKNFQNIFCASTHWGLRQAEANLVDYLNSNPGYFFHQDLPVVEYEENDSPVNYNLGPKKFEEDYYEPGPSRQLVKNNAGQSDINYKMAEYLTDGFDDGTAKYIQDFKPDDMKNKWHPFMKRSPFSYFDSFFEDIKNHLPDFSTDLLRPTGNNNLYGFNNVKKTPFDHSLDNHGMPTLSLLKRKRNQIKTSGKNAKVEKRNQFDLRKFLDQDTPLLLENGHKKNAKKYQSHGHKVKVA